MKTTGRYQEGAQSRQRVLDYLHQNPGSIAPVISRALGVSKSVCAKRLADMCDAGELRREDAIMEFVNVKGRVSRLATYAYWPLVRETRNKAPGVAKKGPCEPWRTRSCDLRDPYTDKPYPNQGGQGSARPRLATYMEMNA